MRLRILAVVLGFAAVGVLFASGYLTTQHVDARIQVRDMSGFLVTFRIPCGSVVSPTHEAPPAGWHYSGQSCAQELAWLRHGALVWAPIAAGALGAAAVFAVLVDRRRGGQLRGATSAVAC